MRKIAVYIVVSTLLALSACDSVGQRAAVAAAAQVGAGIAFATVEPPQDTIPTVVRRVWKDADFLISPSPDGRFVSLTDWNTGDVAVRDLETGELRHVTQNPMPWVPGFALFPQTSPGGDQIAYSWWRNEEAEFELRVVDWDGSEPRTLLAKEQRVLALAWAPDGQHILVIRTRRDAGEQELALVATADGSVTVLVSTGRSAPRGVAFSPDGRFIAYDLPSEEHPDQRDIFVLNLDGRRRARIVDDMSNDYLLGWAPTGGHILYCSDRTGTPGVWLLPVRDGLPTGEPELVLPDTWGVQPVGFLSGGRYYYAVQTGARDIFTATLGADYGSVVAPPTLATPRRFGHSGYPAWSPDGRHLAYIRTQGVIAGLNTLVIRSLETGEIRELALGDGLKPIAALRWAPDGRSFMLMAGDDTGVTGIYRVDVQTGRSEVLVSGRDLWDTGDGIDVSPDGRFLYYRTKIEDEDPYWPRVFRKDLDTGNVKEVYKAPVGIVRNVAVSPDGSSLALSLQALDEGKHQIVVLPANGGEARPATPPTNGITSIAWTPDGEAIVYSMAESFDVSDQTYNLWRVPVAGGEPELVGLEMDMIRYPRFHPDGRRIAFVAGSASFELWVMEGFLPGSR